MSKSFPYQSAVMEEKCFQEETVMCSTKQTQLICPQQSSELSTRHFPGLMLPERPGLLRAHTPLVAGEGARDPQPWQ